MFRGRTSVGLCQLVGILSRLRSKLTQDLDPRQRDGSGLSGVNVSKRLREMQEQLIECIPFVLRTPSTKRLERQPAGGHLCHGFAHPGRRRNITHRGRVVRAGVDRSIRRLAHERADPHERLRFALADTADALDELLGSAYAALLGQTRQTEVGTRQVRDACRHHRGRSHQIPRLG